MLLYLDTNKEQSWVNADIRLMCFGQETNTWCGGLQSNAEGVQKCYQEFFNTGDCKRYGGQFWNGVHHFLDLLKKQYPNKKVDFLWNNIIKIGKSSTKGTPPSHIRQLEEQHFDVISQEVEILKPNLVLFFTGPYYDSILQRVLPETKGSYQNISTFSKRQLSKINLTNADFAYRTYHPNYLWRNKIDNYFRTILNDTSF